MSGLPMQQRRAPLLDHLPLTSAMIFYVMMRYWAKLPMPHKLDAVRNWLHLPDEYMTFLNKELIDIVSGADGIALHNAEEIMGAIHKNFNVGREEKDILSDPHDIFMGLVQEFFPERVKDWETMMATPTHPVSADTTIYVSKEATPEEQEALREKVRKFYEELFGDVETFPNHAEFNITVRPFSSRGMPYLADTRNITLDKETMSPDEESPAQRVEESGQTPT